MQEIFAMHDPILLVEPDEESRIMFREALQRAGYPVVEARTGEEAICAVFRNHPCAIVMECSVPGVSGLRATEVLKEESEFRKLPILLLGSERDADEERRAHEARCDLYLPRPSSPKPMLEAIQRIAGPGPKRKKNAGHWETSRAESVPAVTMGR